MKNITLNFKIMQTAYVYTRYVHFSFSILYYTSQYFLLVANRGVAYLQYYIYSAPSSMV
jgi:hypothetical protein